MILVALFFILATACTGENVQLTINSKYIDYVAEIVDRTFIGGYGPTLVGKELPGSEGTLYKIGGLVMNQIDLGFSSGSVNEGHLVLSLNNASASVEGFYEAYTFWTTTGNLTLDLAGSLHLNVSVLQDNTLNVTRCHANYTLVDLDLQKSSVNWLAPILKPMIESQIQDILCDVIDTYLINKTNSLILSLPEEMSGDGGGAGLQVTRIALTPGSVDLEVQIGAPGEGEVAGFSDLKQDMCLQVKEEVVDTLSAVFLPPGTFSTAIDVMWLLYGDASAAHDDVKLHVQNNDTMRLGFGEASTIMGRVSVGSEIKVTPHGRTEVLSLGKLAMSGTVEARCNYAGRQHVAQYAINRLLPQNKYLVLSGFNLATTKRAMVGCSNMRLREEFVEEIIERLTS